MIIVTARVVIEPGSRDEDALANHFKQPHIRKLVEALGRYTAEPPVIVAHAVTDSRPLM